MKKNVMKILLLTAYVFTVTFLFSQSQKVGVNEPNPAVTLDVNGSVKIGNDNNNSSPAGTIRFNPETGDFEGFDGNEWVTLSPNPQDLFWPSIGNRGVASNYYAASPADAVQGDGFGFAVAMDGLYAAIGSPYWSSYKGRVHIYKREPAFGFWNLVQVLEGQSAGDQMGFSVALSGNKLVVGLPGANNNFGKALIFSRTGTVWNLETSLTPGNSNHKRFGHDVDIDGEKIVVSSPDPNPSGGLNEGLVWIYHFSAPSVYTVSVVSTPHSMPFGENMFGFAVGISGEWLAVSAPFHNDDTGIDSDSVYIFHQDTGNEYTHTQSLSGPEKHDQFGYSLAINESVLVIGSRNESTLPAFSSNGACRGYFLDNGVWQQNYQCRATGDFAFFGNSVSTTSDLSILSSINAVGPVSPLVKIMKKENGTFASYLNIEDPAATASDHMVHAVAISSNYFVIGIPYGESLNGLTGGRVYFGRVR